jgi:hypothetical protein
MWLLQSSLDVLSVEWDSASTAVTSKLTVHQAAFSTDYPLLRYHKVNIAFFKADGSYTTQTELIANEAITTITYDGSQGVKAVLVNVGHQDFVKYVIDNTSLAFFQANINSINKTADAAEGALTRMIIWNYMNEMVRDGRLKLLPYLDTVLANISKETEDSIYNF